MMWIAIILGLVSLLLIYIIWNLSRKLSVYEKINDAQLKWIEFSAEEVKSVYTKLKSVDSRNLFEKDDDVGFVFSEILNIIKEFNGFINNYEEIINEKVDQKINFEKEENTEDTENSEIEREGSQN
jgi:hypothetical protein